MCIAVMINRDGMVEANVLLRGHWGQKPQATQSSALEILRRQIKGEGHTRETPQIHMCYTRFDGFVPVMVRTRAIQKFVANTMLGNSR